MTTTATVPHWIGGARVEGIGGTAPVTDPATGEVTAHVALATPTEVDAAVASASAAFPAWRDTSLARPTKVLFAFPELLNARAPELAALMTAEHGKVLSDAAGEVARGQEVVELACGMPLTQGRLHQERPHRGGRALRAPAAGRRHRQQPVQLPGDDPDVVLPGRHRRRQLYGAQAE